MSNIPDEYEMQAGTSGLLETCDESRMLIESVGTIVEKNTTQDENYFVVTEVNGEQANLIQITEAEKLDEANSNDHKQLWVEVCRICANTSDHLIPIFEGEGLEHELNNKIHKYLPIQVSEEDNLPLHLCYHCAATLLAWHELADGCLDAEQRLLQMQNEFQHKDQPNMLGESLDEGSAALTTEDSRVSVKNPSSDEDFDVKAESNEESTPNDSERLTNYIRPPRSSSFIHFRSAYQALLRSYQRQVKPIYKSISRDTKSNQWLDIVSLDNSRSPVDVSGKTQVPEKESIATIVLQSNMTNISNHENKSIELIAESFSHPIDEKHENMVDTSSSRERNFEDVSSKDDQQSFADVPSVSTKTSYDCKVCGKKFRLQDSFRAHMHIHTDTKRFTCHICGKQFGQTGSLYYHLKHVHGGVKQHSCDLCGRSFAMKAAMEDHRRIHTGERPYCCASCGKTFKTKASLYIHSKTHTDELPHKCSYCSKAFRWKQQMLGHLTIHTGQKNHICEICGKRFGVKNDLTRHKRIHSEEKPFMCQQCGLSFGQKRYLKNHERTRHR